MNSQGECGSRRRRADRIAESLARDVRELQEREEAHLAALHILRTRLARVEALLNEGVWVNGVGEGFVRYEELAAALDGEATS